MITKEAIRKVAETKINSIDGFFVDLKVNTANVITLFFDRNDGVEVKHCLEVSKHIEEHFDRNIEDYELNVCSAGLDNPFIVDQQYHKHKGKEVGVLRTNGKRCKGIILSYVNDILTLEVVKKKKGNKKEKTFEKVVIPKSEIKETKLKINFK
ncbi:MAG: ribosome assembly cofactor RimP [Bacteroidota bacterium]|nr:ribosome assembly cofactor RimP [Bacteroidota bacterium]